MGDGYCLSNNSRDGLNREYSYPSIHQGPDGALYYADLSGGTVRRIAAYHPSDKVRRLMKGDRDGRQ
mgnify:CR=1 FL=1